ncbi:MAG: response regulator [Rhodospirillales bacterium]|nr:response regulator [Rhodospirillales bacterium]
MSDDAHILVVDDDARLRGLLSRYLSSEGYRVTAAESAADARSKLRSINPDLLVLDVMMPGETGLALTESLRRESGHDLPVLLLTARGAPEDRIAGFEAGADDYLGKPFEPRELLLRIRAMLRRAAPPPPETATPPIRLGPLTFDVSAPATGRLVEIPGVFSQGATLEELQENIQDAYELVVTQERAPAPPTAERQPLELEV